MSGDSVWPQISLVSRATHSFNFNWSIENDFDGTLYDIVDRAYEMQNDFQKANSIYMELYRSSKEEVDMINKVNQLLDDYLKLHNEALIKKENKEKSQTVSK